MKYQKNKHNFRFSTEAKKTNYQNKTKMAILYLLTADNNVWNVAKHHRKNNSFDFNAIKIPSNANSNAYILLSVAKDIASGTNYLSIADLTDTNLINNQIFNIIMSAIFINRYGVPKALII